MDLGAAADIANLAFHKNVRAYCLQLLNGCSRLANVFLERQRGNIKHDPVESGLGSCYGTGQRVCVIRVQENGEIVLVTKALHHRRNLAVAYKLTFAFGRTYNDGHV